MFKGHKNIMKAALKPNDYWLKRSPTLIPTGQKIITSPEPFGRR